MEADAARALAASRRGTSEARPKAEIPAAPRYVFGADGGASPLPLDKLAKVLRDCLMRAGVERHEIHNGTERRMRVGTHDLRATFVTIFSALGKNEKWISKRTGHKSHSMIATYQRDPEDFAEGEAVRLLPLVEAIPELRPAQLAEEPGSVGGEGSGNGGAERVNADETADRRIL